MISVHFFNLISLVPVYRGVYASIITDEAAREAEIAKIRASSACLVIWFIAIPKTGTPVGRSSRAEMRLAPRPPRKGQQREVIL